MSKQLQPEHKDYVELHLKIMDIEDSVGNIKTFNNLLIPYAREYSPEVSIIAGLIDDELEKIFKILLK